jgi:hypothetical protein
MLTLVRWGIASKPRFPSQRSRPMGSKIMSKLVLPLICGVKELEGIMHVKNNLFFF